MDTGKEKIQERITPDEWHGIHDRETGSHELISPDKKTKAKLDYSREDHALDVTLFEKIRLAAVSLKSFLFSLFDDEVKAAHAFGENIVINAFDTEITIENGNITIYHGGNKSVFVGEDETKNVTNDAAWSIGGNLKINVVGTIDIVSGGVTKINGAVIKLN
jgi:hypothetical protein